MTMKYTSAQANKRLKKLTDEYVSLREKESRSREFRAAAGENVEAVRPAYDYADTQRRLAELEPQMQAHFAGRIDVYHSEPYFLEAMPLGCTKATALEMLLDKLGLSRENLMVCGDSGNDLAMIRFAGLGVAMGNADEDVKAQADFVSTSNDEDGVAVAIEKFVLGRAECL